MTTKSTKEDLEQRISILEEEAIKGKKAEDALRKSEEKYRNVVENSQEAIFIAQDGKLVFVNRATLNLTGYSEKKFMSEPFTEFIHPDDRNTVVNNHFRRLKGEEVPPVYSFRILRNDGTARWVELKATIVSWEGKPATLNFLSDITERKQAEKALWESEKKYSQLFMNAPAAIFEVDYTNRRFSNMNEIITTMTGYSRKELTQMDPWEMLTEESQKIYLDRMNMIKEGLDVPIAQEYTLRKKDGGIIWVNMSIDYEIANGLPVKARIVAHDITEHKLAEEEHRKLERQLFQSQKMEEIGQLAGGVAHALNNILTGIQGNTFLLQMEYDPDHPHYQKLRQIEEQVKRGANLMKQLLGFAQEGRYELKPISINDMIRRNIQFFIETKREIEAELQLPDSVHPVEADAGQIEQVFLNIYINAGHAMPRGGRIDIQTSNVNILKAEAKALEIKPGDYVLISITDTGTGMDKETLQRIFEPFFTTKAEQGGTGLGMASAYGIIRKHGGVIKAYSKPGAGSTFNIYLPASRKKVAPEDQVQDQKLLLSGSGGILLVDDESMILDSAAEMLKMLGYSVYPAANGWDAVAAYREKQSRIDLVILDMIMPGMNGSQVLKMLKSINPDIKVILSSGYSMQGELLEVMEMGCLGFIQKPYKFTDLSKIVHQAICNEDETDTD